MACRQRKCVSVTGGELTQNDLEADAGLARGIGKFFVDKALGDGKSDVPTERRKMRGVRWKAMVVHSTSRRPSAVCFENDDDLYKF